MMTVEEMAYELGGIYSASKRHGGNPEREKVLARALEDAGALVEDDRRGNGWRVHDDGGMHCIPGRWKAFVWSEKAWAWAFWMGMGQPRDHLLKCQSDPLEETKVILGEATHVDFSVDELVIKRGRGLRLV